MTYVRHTPRVDAAASVDAATDPVLSAARDLALDVGFRRTTISDVARRASVSRMTIYRQYEDLQAIWSALLTRELVEVLVDVEGEADDDRSARERLADEAVQVATRISGHPLLRRALDLDPELLLPLVVDRLGSTQRAALARAEALVVDGHLDGSVRADVDPATAAFLLLLLVQSMVFSTRVVDDRPDAADIRGDELRALVDRYLRP